VVGCDAVSQEKMEETVETQSVEIVKEKVAQLTEKENKATVNKLTGLDEEDFAENSIPHLQDFLDRGGNINTPSDFNGLTLLHAAVNDQDIEKVMWLIKNEADVNAGADANIKNRNGASPKTLFKEGGHLSAETIKDIQALFENQ